MGDDLGSDHEEGGRDMLAPQQTKQPGGPGGIGAVVEGERHFAIRDGGRSDLFSAEVENGARTGESGDLGPSLEGRGATDVVAGVALGEEGEREGH
jgi:hypothetical protein